MCAPNLYLQSMQFIADAKYLFIFPMDFSVLFTIDVCVLFPISILIEFKHIQDLLCLFFLFFLYIMGNQSAKYWFKTQFLITLYKLSQQNFQMFPFCCLFIHLHYFCAWRFQRSKQVRKQIGGKRMTHFRIHIFQAGIEKRGDKTKT